MMSSTDEDNNDTFLFSSSNEYLFDEVQDDEFFDCYLSEREISEFLAPSTEKWEDVNSFDTPTRVTIDESKKTQWEHAQEEIKFVHGRLKDLTGVEDIQANDVMDYIIGPKSVIGKFFQDTLDLTSVDYIKFMRTLAVQSAYRISSTQLFDEQSLLFKEVPMSQSEYNGIWLSISTMKRLDKKNLFIAAGRRDKCIWESLEEILNNLCRSISICNRTGKIFIALDDDKIWVSLTGVNKEDLFGLKFTTHVKANRKGLVAHTAVSTGANIPLGIIFERKKDSTFDCFKRLLTFLFERNGVCDLRNVLLASDRGYMVPNNVFNFLIVNGANFVGTVKRMAQCWPFTFDQKTSENDKRRKVETKGPPTLFVKKVDKQTIKRVDAIAFRNGSESVSTAVSSIHRGHHWEGIALNQQELKQYEDDPSSLKSKTLQRVKSDLLSQDETEEETYLIDDLLLYHIDPITLRQGKTESVCLIINQCITSKILTIRMYFVLFLYFYQALLTGIICASSASHRLKLIFLSKKHSLSSCKMSHGR